MISPRRLIGLSVSAVLAASLCALSGTGISVATAATPRTVSLTPIADIHPRGSSFLGSSEVDGPSHRAFVVDAAGKTVEVFNTAGNTMVPVASIASVGSPYSTVLGTTSKRLYVGSSGARSISIIDTDPASATANTVVKTVNMPAVSGVLSASADRLALDEGRGLLFATRLSDKSLTIFDLSANTQRHVVLTTAPSDVAVDQASGVAFVSSRNDKAISTVAPDGSVVVTPMKEVGELAVVEGDLIAATGRSISTTLTRFDPETWAVLGETKALGNEPTALVADVSTHLVYAGFSSGDVTVALADTLNIAGAFPAVADNPALAVDLVTHRLYTADGAHSGGSPAHFRSFQPDLQTLPAVDRIGGADRFDVSSGVSADQFSPGVAVAYVASGAGFADALSGSAAAGAKGAPVLLVGKETIPGSVASELTRLKPTSIVILGGTATVGSAVEAQLQGYGVPVARVGGADRYEVSANLSSQTFSPGVSNVYLASGEVFSDALSASAGAGNVGGPVLLVSRGVVPPSVLAEIERLRPGRIVVVGGPATINDDVVTTLASRWQVERVSGADRFDVSAAVSARAFRPPVSVVYIASGAVFPDALSGSAAAIANEGPVLLVTHDLIPAAVDRELSRLHPYRIVVLGGTSTIDDSIMSRLRSYLPDY